MPFLFPFEFYGGHLLHEEFGHAGFGNVGILQQDAEPDALVMTLGEIKSDLPPIGEIQFAGLLLNSRQLGRM